MTFQPKQGAAIWRQIFDHLSTEIRTGRLHQGAQLPSETALAERFGVNRHTIRHAVRKLAHTGLVRIDRGRGTFVEQRSVDYPVGPRTRFTEILLSKGRVPKREILSIDKDTARTEDRDWLELRTGAAVLRVSNRSFSNGELFAVSRHVFALGRLPGLAELLQSSGSISQSLAALGHTDYRRQRTHITAELPDDDLAQELARAPSRPVLCTESVDVASDGTPLAWARTHFAGDLCRLTVTEPD